MEGSVQAQLQNSGHTRHGEMRGAPACHASYYNSSGSKCQLEKQKGGIERAGALPSTDFM